ncbi:MAG: hypothetical protein RM368_15865 [Nostoc sp. DedSLP03]|uniref:hypothetical protein n=1 Tax=Nostoc sp. DedSLP03 TaxID=3075400 RepID=UPI002AD47094|nr:hypothetical protein [Nostoc sp. DedSLP03]MDZ7966427.1 hypothetical protein [Nostoc sp. DedSLP03]
MAKARRRLSDLVHEETQKIREPNLQTSEVTKSESLAENPSEAEDQITDLQTLEATNSVTLSESEPLSKTESTEQQTTKVTDLQTLEATNSVTLSESEPLSKTESTEQQTAKVTDLQTSEATNSEGLLETPRQVEDKVTEQQTAKVTDLQTSEATNSVTIPESSSEVEKRVTEQQASNVTDLQTNKYSESVSSMQIAIRREGEEEVNKTTKLQSLKDTDLQSTELPKYLKLERKETRLRQDQIDALTDLTRKLNRTKQVKGGERLTDNTLIRVAVDLLLSKASELQGTTEDELRSSLNL